MTIRLSGLGSGIDVEALIQGLVQANSIQLNSLNSRASRVNGAVSSVSEVGTLFATLEGAARALDTINEVSSFSATSDDTAIVASAGPNAAAGNYSIVVDHLAQAERTYSSALSDSADEALGFNGTLTLQVGTGDLADPDGTLLIGAPTLAIEIDPSDSVQTIVDKINGGDLRVRAATFFDGTGYRIQVSGLDVGADNDVVFDEGGLAFGFNAADATVQSAQDALLHVDGLAVTSKSNQVTAIQGVTLALAGVPDGPVNITVGADAKSLSDKVESFVKAYNDIVNKVHVLTGFGTTPAVNSTLAADSTLRSVLSRLGSTLSTTFGNGQFNTLRSIGISLNNNGTLTLDKTKLGDAVTKDFGAVKTLFAGNDVNQGTLGIADLLRDLADEISGPGGAIDIKQQSLRSQVKGLEDSGDREQVRLDRLAEQLRRSFSALDSTVSNNQAQLQYLLSFSGR